MTQTDELRAHVEALGKASGTVARDFDQITGDSEGSWQQLVNNINRTATALGDMTGRALNPALDVVNDQLARMTAYSEGMDKVAASGRSESEYRARFREERSRLFPQENSLTAWLEGNKAFREAVEALGRGEISNIFDPLRAIERQRKLATEYGRAAYVPGRGLASEQSSRRPPATDHSTMTPMQRMVEGYRAGGERSYGAGPDREQEMRARIASDGLAFDFEAMEAKLKSGGAEAGSQIAGGVTQGGAAAAGDIGSAIRAAGAEVARLLRETVANISVNVRGAPAAADTGQAVRVESQGQAVDFGGRRR